MSQKKKIVVTVGLPASGKSTWVKEQLKQNKRSIRLNRDDMRAMLYNDICLDKREEVITATLDAMADAALTNPKVDVVYNDNTNLSEKYVDYWKEKAAKFGANFEVVDFTHMPVDTCIERDTKREKRVGRAVIEKMALKAGLLDLNTHDKWCLVDCDGTLSLLGSRRNYVTGEKKDWASFFREIDNDEVNAWVAEDVRKLYSQGVGVIILSGRPTDLCGIVTEDWLNRYGIPYHHLLLRNAKDSRPDTIIKEEILDMLLNHISLENIVTAYDDRQCIIKLWKSRGIPVVECGDGSEY